ALMPTTRPCLLAWVPSGTTPRRPVTRSTVSTQSPAAHTPSTLVFMRESVTMPPVSPIAMPAASARRGSGRTPRPSTTTSAGSIRRAVHTARTAPPSVSKPSTGSPMCRVTPTARKASATSAPMSASSVAASGCSVRSINATSSPRRTSASAISRPMYPPPTITARSGARSSIAPDRHTVGEGLHAEDAVGVDAGHLGPERDGAGGHDELIERLVALCAACGGHVAHPHAPPVDVDPHDIVLGAHVDAVAPVLLGCARDELVDVRDEIADEVGNAT